MLRALILTKYDRWSGLALHELRPSGYPECENSVFVHLCACCAKKKKKGEVRGPQFLQRPIDCRGFGSGWFEGGVEVEEGWGCALIPHIDL